METNTKEYNEKIKREEEIKIGKQILESLSAEPNSGSVSRRKKRGAGYTRKKVKTKSKRYIKMQKASRIINRRKRKKT